MTRIPRRRMLLLGFRFAKIRNSLELARSVGVSLVSALMCAGVLVPISGVQIIGQQQAVRDARTPREPAQLTSHEPLRQATLRNIWGGREITREVVYLADRKGTPHPPGVQGTPSDGEAYVSPAVLEEAKTNPGVAMFLGHLEVIGVIQGSGLVSPRELRVVQGVRGPPPAGVVTVSAEGYGANTERAVDLTGPFAIVVPLLVVLSLAPLCVALLLTLNLLRPEQLRRNTVLESLGLPPTAIRFVAAIEQVPAAVTGVCAGVFFFVSCWCRLDGVPGTSLHFFSRDAALSYWTYLAVAALCVVSVCSMASFVTRDTRLITRPTLGRRRPRMRQVWPCLIALTAFGALATLHPEGNLTARNRTLIAAGFVAATLPLGVSVLIDLSARSLARVVRSPGALVGARWAAIPGAGTARMALGLSTLMVVVATSLPFATLLRGDDSFGQSGLAAARGYNVTVSGSALSPRDSSRLSEVRRSIGLLTAEDSEGNPLELWVARCSDLSAMFQGVTHCSGLAQFLLDPRDVPPPSIAWPIALDSGSRLPRMPVSPKPAHATIGPAITPLRLDPSVVDRDEGAHDLLVNVANPGPAADRFEANLAAVAPGAWTGNNFESVVQQSHAGAGQLEAVGVAGTFGAAALLVALAAALIRAGRERSIGEERLWRMGSPPVVAQRAAMVATAIPVGVSQASTAIVVGCLWLGASRVAPIAAVPATGYGWLLVTPIAITGLACLFSYAGAGRRWKS